MKQCSATLSRRGFSLIEILVAMSILVVIVLIVGGLFQQTSLAWTLGMQRATEQSNVRAVAGALGRDLASMVDPGNLVIYPSKTGGDQAGALSKGLGGTTSNFVSSGSLKFWALRAPDMFDEATLKTLRELVLIEYTASGNKVTRTVSAYDNPTKPTSAPSSKDEQYGGSTSEFDLGDGSISFEAIDEGFADFASPYGSNTAGVRIVVTPTKPSTITGYEIYVGSCGPDGIKGNEDDIYPWGEGEAE